jgi:acetylglutamate kinase
MSQIKAPNNLDAFKKAEVLIEALPWIQQFAHKIVVVKYGGNAMVDNDLKEKFAKDISFMKTVGLRPVVVHGGGPQISTMLKKLGIESEFKGGFRVTTEDAMDVVRMVLTGKISRELIGLINNNAEKDSGYAIGLSGEDAKIFQAVRKTHNEDGIEVDLGLVGDIVGVDTSAINSLLANGRIPVISSVAPNINNSKEVLNINADIAAGELAKALGAVKLVILTDVAGLYENFEDKNTLISEIGTVTLEKLLPSLQSGMIPKVTSCINAVKSGVKEAHIIDGRISHSLVTEIFTSKGIGTLINAGDTKKYYENESNSLEGENNE